MYNIDGVVGVRSLAEPLGDPPGLFNPFSAEGRRVHKVVHHFLLEAVGGTLSVEGDPDREAVDAEWVPLEELEQRLTFANERRLARDVSQLLSDQG